MLKKRLIATAINIIINVKMSIADLNDDNEKIVFNNTITSAGNSLIASKKQ